MMHFKLVPKKDGPVVNTPDFKNIYSIGLEYVYDGRGINFMRKLFPNNNVVHFHENVVYNGYYQDGKHINPYDLYIIVKTENEYVWYHYNVPCFDTRTTEINFDVVEEEKFQAWRGYEMTRF